jgi:hypothetical protein
MDTTEEGQAESLAGEPPDTMADNLYDPPIPPGSSYSTGFSRNPDPARALIYYETFLRKTSDPTNDLVSYRRFCSPLEVLYSIGVLYPTGGFVS